MVHSRQEAPKTFQPVFYIISAILLSDWIFGVLGVIMTAMTGFALWYTDKERMDKEALRIRTRM